LLENKNTVTLFTRPRRFGKTLAQTMIKTFFEKEILPDGTVEDNSVYFQGKKIMEAGEEYLKHMGQYPVIFMSLKPAKQPTYEMAYKVLNQSISKEFIRHRYILDSEVLLPVQKARFNLFIEEKAEPSDYATALQFLPECLEQYHEQKTIILLDEYDVPLENAYFNGFYDEMVKFIRLFFGSALKTNEYLEFAVLTGCLRVSKESIFTGLNNFEVMGISDTRFSGYFGFTGGEVKEILEYYGLEDKYTLFKEWYDGYRFGNTEIYCPWDVINQCKLLCEDSRAPMQPYWINSSGNDIVRDILRGASANTREQVESLVSEESIKRVINTDLTYADLKNADGPKKETYLWSILYATGYLTDSARPEGKIHTLVILNKEILEIYKEQVLSWFNTKA